MMTLISPSPKALQTFHRYRRGGVLTDEDAEEQQAFLVIGKQGHYLVGNCVVIYWLVDRVSGQIINAKFQYFGHPYLLILAETVCHLAIGKVYTSIQQISFEEINQELKPHSHVEALPEASSLFHMILDVLDILIDECKQLPITNIRPQLPSNLEDMWGLNPEDADPYNKEEWERFTKDQQLNLLKQFVNEKIAPFIAMDEGSVSIENLKGNVVTIAYSGNCSNCYSSLGSTLNSISQMLTTYIYEGLTVKVNEASLNFSPFSNTDTPPIA